MWRDLRNVLCHLILNFYYLPWELLTEWQQRFVFLLYNLHFPLNHITWAILSFPGRKNAPDHIFKKTWIQLLWSLGHFWLALKTTSPEKMRTFSYKLQLHSMLRYNLDVHVACTLTLYLYRSHLKLVHSHTLTHTHRQTLSLLGRKLVKMINYC